MENQTLPSNVFAEVVRLTKENNQLKEEVKHLRDMLMQSAQVLKFSGTTLSIDPVSNEELICIEQIQYLRNESKVRDLTLEECKKVDTYVKTLDLIRKRLKVTEDAAQGKTVDELLAAVENEK